MATSTRNQASRSSTSSRSCRSTTGASTGAGPGRPRAAWRTMPRVRRVSEWRSRALSRRSCGSLASVASSSPKTSIAPSEFDSSCCTDGASHRMASERRPLRSPVSAGTSPASGIVAISRMAGRSSHPTAARSPSDGSRFRRNRRCTLGRMEQPAAGPNGNVFLVSAARTPIGKFGGALANVPARSSAPSRSGPPSTAPGSPSDAPIDEVFMGQVLQAGAGQAPARQALLGPASPTRPPPRRSTASAAPASSRSCSPPRRSGRAMATCSSRAAWSR